MTRDRRYAALWCAGILAVLLGGCEKRDIPLIGVFYESGRGAEVAIQAPRPQLHVIKAKAPLPQPEIEKLMREHPLILECHCVQIEEKARQAQKPPQQRRDYSIPREESERRQALAAQRGITILVERRLTFHVHKVIKGVCTETEIQIDDRDGAVRFADKEEEFFYLRTAETPSPGSGPFRYGLFFNRATIAESNMVIIVRMPLPPAKLPQAP